MTRPLAELTSSLLAVILDPEDAKEAASQLLPSLAEEEPGDGPDLSLLQQYNSAMGSTAKGRKGGAPKWWVPPFLPLSDDDMVRLKADAPHLEEAYYDHRDMAFISLSPEELAGLDDKGRSDYEAAAQAVSERAAAKQRAKDEEAARKAEEKRQRLMTPRDKDDNRCAMGTAAAAGEARE